MASAPASPALAFEPTAEQRAVLDFTGPRLLVDGPPGSGKTTIAAVKAGRLTHELGEHQRLLFLTFTNNATDRIGEALNECLTQEERRKVVVINYHSLFYRMIRSWGPWVGLPGAMHLMSEAEHKDLYQEAKETIGRAGLPVDKGERVPFAFKKALAMRDGYLGQLAEEGYRTTEIMAGVKELAHKSGRLHFDDFEYYALKILGSKRIADAYRRQFPVIFVDEFQDVNDLQYQFLKRLAQGGMWFCFGDSQQTIYTWAGASPARLANFATEERAEVITLIASQRYRRRSGIGMVAEAFRHMVETPPSAWQKVAVRSRDVMFYPCHTRGHQFSYAVKLLPSFRPRENRIVCLLPRNDEVRAFSQRLSAAGVRHSSLLDDEEQRHWEDALLAALAVAAGDGAWERLGRAVNYALDIQSFRDPAKLTQLEKRLSGLAEAPTLEARLHEAARQFAGVGAGTESESLRRAVQSLSSLARQVTSVSPDSPAAVSQLGHLLQQRRVAETFRGRREVSKGITVMTFHKAKGKEFDVAVLFTPNRQSRHRRGDWWKDEWPDLRTWHVAVSRAKSKLVFFYTESQVSPFLEPFL